MFCVVPVAPSILPTSAKYRRARTEGFSRTLVHLFPVGISRWEAQLTQRLKEWETGFDRNQTAWSQEAKNLAEKSLNAALRAARENAARLLEESSRENAALIRKAFDDGFGRMRETLAVAQVIVWLALSAALVALGTACYILRLH